MAITKHFNTQKVNKLSKFQEELQEKIYQTLKANPNYRNAAKVIAKEFNKKLQEIKNTHNKRGILEAKIINCNVLTNNLYDGQMGKSEAATRIRDKISRIKRLYQDEINKLPEDKEVLKSTLE